MTGTFVYVIRGAGNRHKIGVSIDPITRIADLQTGSPEPLDFAYIGVTPGTGYNIESLAHDLLDDHCVSGEWFAVPASIAIGTVLEAANRLAEPIQQVQPAMVPQIIQLAKQPDPATGKKPAPRWMWWTLWACIAIFALLVLLVETAPKH
ncbi:GIY-YIG nuclease family protein [Bradyrhizobium septentrionale]|uniref:GIY-YIG nuclease family protein n=1 Tax=Bradyrhizobium septentrionale TaxID=1404411 RepID=UPI0015966D4F|nr:GIY-YIG nuclease family protein [Bradyrhizobium septentrionale]UGY23717.1 GIY-YIG nuclease family protein [Bradyrhizobium septentrionale]